MDNKESVLARRTNRKNQSLSNRTLYGTQDEKNVGMELQKEYLKNVSGKYIEPEIYNEKYTKIQAKKYDLAYFTNEMDPFV